MTPITLMNWPNYEIDMGDTYEFVSNFNAYLVDLEALIPQINTVVQEAEAARDAAEATAGFDGTYASLTGIPTWSFSSLTDVTATPAEVDHLVGVTSPLQGQINSKAAGGHSHGGVYEPVDGSILRDADIGVSVLSPDAIGVSVLAPDGDASELTNLPLPGMSLARTMFYGSF